MQEELNVIVTFQHISDKAEMQIKAKSISLFNEVGPFDVLPGHANLISTIHSSIIIQSTDNQHKEIKFARGVLEVSGNIVNIFLEEDSAQVPS